MHGLNAEFVQPAIVASKTVAGAQCHRVYPRDSFEINFSQASQFMAASQTHKSSQNPAAGANNGIKTTDLDNLCAETCA
jgi:hypothetical protein